MYARTPTPDITRKLEGNFVLTTKDIRNGFEILRLNIDDEAFRGQREQLGYTLRDFSYKSAETATTRS